MPINLFKSCVTKEMIDLDDSSFGTCANLLSKESFLCLRFCAESCGEQCCCIGFDPCFFVEVKGVITLGDDIGSVRPFEPFEGTFGGP